MVRFCVFTVWAFARMSALHIFMAVGNALSVYRTALVAAFKCS